MEEVKRIGDIVKYRDESIINCSALVLRNARERYFTGITLKHDRLRPTFEFAQVSGVFVTELWLKENNE